ncbi:MAG: SCP2 sterol-binding domain-containing protein [Piscinibacter sp.]|nr:SCP2 sterol-binding domain-containing protein [Piscinibacter sp.]
MTDDAMNKPIACLALAAATLLAGAARAEPLMSDAWTAKACEQWNKTPILTDDLADKWIKNDGGKGFKVIQLYRTDCGEASRTELRVTRKDGKALCSYGGKVETVKLDSGVDYVMHASTARWTEMGRGDYGPMRAMMFGRLEFVGPKMEAMGVMGPFESFLLLVGKVEGDTTACPK